MRTATVRATLAALLLLAAAPPAHSDEPPPAPGSTPAAAPARLRVALLPFEGTQGARAYAELKKLLEPMVDLAPEADAAAAAKKEGTSDPGQIAAVADALQAKLVLFGSVRKKGGGLFTVELRDDTGGVVRVLEYPYGGGRLEASTLKAMRKDVEAIVTAEAARLSQPVTPPPEEPAVPAFRVPLVDAALGLLLGGRQFGFGKGSTADGLATCQPGPTSCPAFRGAIAGGLRLDATFFPMRLLPEGSSARRLLGGLGVGATYDIVAWPESIDDKSPPANCAGASPCRSATREQRLEAGLRYRTRLLERRWGPVLFASLQYGLHSFSLTPPTGAMTVVPSVGYSYIDLGVGLQIALFDRLSLSLSVNAHPTFSGGAIESATEFGPASIFGIRGNLGAQAKLWRDLSLRLTGFYEVMWLSFSGSGMPPKTTDGGARDAYWGVAIGPGYEF